MSYYEINVSKLDEKGKPIHFFATAPRSCDSKARCLQVLEELNKRFPKSEGFHVHTTFQKCSGYILSSSEDVEQFDPWAE